MRNGIFELNEKDGIFNDRNYRVDSFMEYNWLGNEEMIIMRMRE